MAHTSTGRKSDTAHGQGDRRSNSKEKQGTKRPVTDARYGFLSHTFEPVITTIHEELKNKHRVEQSFFCSLDNLASLYGFEVKRFAGKVYPYNLNLVFDHVKNCLAQVDKNLELQVIQDDRHKACLTTFQTMTTGQQLYYLPVKPLAALSKNRKDKGTARLLVSLFANLYRRGIAWFGDGASFLSGNYEMIREWITENPDDWEGDDYQNAVADLNAMERYGDKLYNLIQHAHTAEQLGSCIRSFAPRNDLEQEVMQVAEQYLNLFQQFPDTNFFSHMYPGLMDTEDDTIMFPDHYLSFYWTDDDSIHQSLMENVNATLNECSEMVEPTTIQFFDKPQERQRQDCYFEWRFLLLTDYLCDILFRML